MALTALNKLELELDGYTVVKMVIDPALAQQAIELTDQFIGGATPIEIMPAERYQAGPWPEGRPMLGEGARLPVCATGGYRHTIWHPIHAPHMPHIMAELVEPLIGINAELLNCPVDRLKLLQQNLTRTDVSPPPHPGHDGVPPSGWHMDQAFLPRHYGAGVSEAPCEMFYHTIMALSPVCRGLAPFFAATGSFRRAKATRCHALGQLIDHRTVQHIHTCTDKLQCHTKWVMMFILS